MQTFDLAEGTRLWIEDGTGTSDDPRQRVEDVGEIGHAERSERVPLNTAVFVSVLVRKDFRRDYPHKGSHQLLTPLARNPIPLYKPTSGSCALQTSDQYPETTLLFLVWKKAEITQQKPNYLVNYGFNNNKNTATKPRHNEAIIKAIVVFNIQVFGYLLQ